MRHQRIRTVQKPEPKPTHVVRNYMGGVFDLTDVAFYDDKDGTPLVEGTIHNPQYPDWHETRAVFPADRLKQA